MTALGTYLKGRGFYIGKQLLPNGAERKIYRTNWPEHLQRPAKREDGVPTRIDTRYYTEAEKAIAKAMELVEAMGASAALTDAVTHLGEARNHVADHIESPIN